MWVQIVTGAFGLGGVISGALLTSFLSRRADQRRIQAEDDRRWLSDRRHAYPAFLALVMAMLVNLESSSAVLSAREGESVPEGDGVVLGVGVPDFYTWWDRELQPALSDILLLAGEESAELADRASWALMLYNSLLVGGTTRDAIERYEAITQHSSATTDLIEALRNAMRRELGVPGPIRAFPMSGKWPWLEDAV